MRCLPHKNLHQQLGVWGRLPAHEQSETERQVADLHGRLVTSLMDRVHTYLDIERPRGSDSLGVVPAVAPPFDHAELGRLNWRPVVRAPQLLKMHPALDEFGWTGGIGEINEAARLKNESVREPIFTTTDGLILSGFGRWRVATLDSKNEIDCFEHPLSLEQALEFILTHHRPRQGWNDFVRICLALTQKSGFQQKAFANMRGGGTNKGFTSLLEARINVCREIAKLAGTGSTNVGKVETILRKAHLSIIAALQNGSLRIHPAWSWCKRSKLEQLDEFARHEEKRTERKILLEFSPGHTGASHQLSEIVAAEQRLEARNPGSIIIRTGRSKRTVVILGEDSLALGAPKEIDGHA
jgi:hypothetical protein